jgi:uridine kinase
VRPAAYARGVNGRADALARLAHVILAVRRDHPTRVAIDGIDAAGKTTLAYELAPLVEAGGREAIRVSLDDFHLPRSRRYAHGELETRYAAGQRLYVDEVDPAARADVVLDNADPAAPVLRIRVHTLGAKP